MTGHKASGGNIFRVGINGVVADGSAAKWRLWLGGCSRRIHIVRLFATSGGSALSVGNQLARYAAGVTFSAAGTAITPTCQNDSQISVPTTVVCKSITGTGTMDPTGTLNAYLKVWDLASGFIFSEEFKKGEFTLGPGEYLGWNQPAGANITAGVAIWFTIE
jgi:hypothetical protein